MIIGAVSVVSWMLHRKWWSVRQMLHFAPPPHSPTTHIHPTLHQHTRLVQSEYDEYREKYHLFDSALFCMPPEHKLRRVCRTILTAQMDPPKQKLSDTHPDQLKKIVKNLITFVIR